MNNRNAEAIKECIENQHSGDKKQLEVIFSTSPRLIVKAPAGYGKTTTMVSRIAFLLASNQVPNPKRILGLTFSVNAALKIKREISQKLPLLIQQSKGYFSLEERIVITNYHGICKRILKKYGYLLDELLREDINNYVAIDEIELVKNSEVRQLLSDDEVMFLCHFSNNIKNTLLPEFNEIKKYNEIVISKLIPKKLVTHNSVITMVLELLTRFSEVKRFYQNYFQLIVIDEFQDTNSISWSLLELLISEKSNLLFLGDPLQRIYGFIGAKPKITEEAKICHDMIPIVLDKNYRFLSNPEMTKLDLIVRKIAEFRFAPEIDDKEVASIPAIWGRTQKEEMYGVGEKIKELLEDDNDIRVATLFRTRNRNSDALEEEMDGLGVEYFYAMFTDEDSEYIEFHRKCQKTFVELFSSSRIINRKTLKNFTNIISLQYPESRSKIENSMFRLLDAFIEKISLDYADLRSEEKYSFIVDVFENRQLKQALEYVDSKVILSTIHGAKGLEWDYVFISDLEKWQFPNQLCINCGSKFFSGSRCRCLLPQPLSDKFTEQLLEELSLFYVGLTRAKKQVYISASATRWTSKGNETASILSCLASLKGIRLERCQKPTDT